MLGRTDEISEFENAFSANPSMSGAINGSFFEKMLGGAMKMVEKEMKKMNEEQTRLNKEMNMQNNNNNNLSPNMKTNFELYINGKKVNLPGNIAGLQIEEMPGSGGALGVNPAHAKHLQKQKMPKISEETLEKSKTLPRKQAKTRLSRTANRVIYELETPGIQSLNNVLISKMENSLEIRAYTEKAVYLKTLPGKLPLMQYSINPAEGKLILEFKAQ
jgi:hypothetical protein